jgi:hypothetical protein
VAGPGLDLGLETLDLEAACAVLAGGETAGGGPGKSAAATTAGGAAKLLRGFVEAEIAGLKRLRGILSGESAEGVAPLGSLLDRCGYLWAHFPDCAGAGGRRPAETDLGFLKRVRAEIDPFITILETVLLRMDDDRA